MRWQPARAEEVFLVRHGETEWSRSGRHTGSTAPAWTIFRDGAPGGESPVQAGARVERLLGKVRAVAGRVALFGHGHLFRVFAARWIGLAPIDGAHFLLDPSTLSILGYYRGTPALQRWNCPADSTRSEVR